MLSYLPMQILDSTERAVEHSLASAGHATSRAAEVYSLASKTTCFQWLLMFVMACMFVMVVLLIRITWWRMRAVEGTQIFCHPWLCFIGNFLCWWYFLDQVSPTKQGCSMWNWETAACTEAWWLLFLVTWGLEVIEGYIIACYLILISKRLWLVRFACGERSQAFEFWFRAPGIDCLRGKFLGGFQPNEPIRSCLFPLRLFKLDYDGKVKL